MKTNDIEFTFSRQDDQHPGKDAIDPGAKISARKKSKSPSQKKRDTERRNIFLMKKLENTNSLIKPSESQDTQQTSFSGYDEEDIVTTNDVPAKKLESGEARDPKVRTKSLGGGTLGFKCDQCNYSSISDKGLRQHIRMKHVISQVDGVDDIERDVDISISENKGIINAHEKETQTDVFLRVDEKNYPKGPSLDLLYDDPPPSVYHPTWGVGKYHSTEILTHWRTKEPEKTYSYRFDDGQLADI